MTLLRAYHFLSASGVAGNGPNLVRSAAPFPVVLYQRSTEAWTMSTRRGEHNSS